MVALDLPWPPKAASPNARVHWAAKNRAAKQYKTDCCFLGKLMKPPAIVDGYMRFTLTFCPPQKRNRDMDNLIASMKAGLDGLALAWGVDDSIFRPEYKMGDIVKFGAVRVSV